MVVKYFYKDVDRLEQNFNIVTKPDLTKLPKSHSDNEYDPTILDLPVLYICHLAITLQCNIAISLIPIELDISSNIRYFNQYFNKSWKRKPSIIIHTNSI